MYTAEEVKHWHSKTLSLLQQEINAENVDDVRLALKFNEHRYYVENSPLVSDFEYDALFKKLQQYEQENPLFIPADSPTKRVGAGLIKNFPKVQHLVPMLSLDNSYNADDLIDFDRKAKELSGLSEITYCVEPKFDGASISLVYEKNNLLRGLTRGNGEVGDDVTPNVYQIKSIPLSADFLAYGIEQIEIRGEVMINKNNFDAYNKQLVAEGLPTMANPRNAASGSLRIKDTAIVAKRNLEAFLYHVSYFTTTTGGKSFPQSHSGILDLLWQLGFKSPAKEKKQCKNIQEVIEYVNTFEKTRDDLPYEIDGMVIKVDDIATQEKLGMTSHHPRWAIAYKFKARQATSKLIGVEYQIGRTGAITPVAKIQPVQVGGVTVQSISIHNQDYIAEKNLKIGDTILIERSGDVIPQIVQSLVELRTGTEQEIDFPTHCPACNAALQRLEGEAVWRCANFNCSAQVVERIIHFVSKDAMDIRSFGDANVRKFFEISIISDIPSIYKLQAAQFANLDGFGAKSITNLLEAIEESKKQPLHRLIYALGIRYVGETTAKTLAQNISNIFELAEKPLEELQQMEDVGIKVATSIAEYFSNTENKALLKELEELGLQTTSSAKAEVTGNLSGKTFLFTGTLSQLKRSNAEAAVEAQGGQILSGVSSKLNYLIVGADAGSKLEKAKKIPTIQILTEEEFIVLIPQ
jgi:DNA ligase (NAD+)